VDNRSNQLQQLFTEGSGLLQAGDAAAALACFQAAREIDPSNAILHLYAGAALHDLGSYEDAIDSYQHAIAIAPNLGEAHNNLGNSLMALDRFAEAADSFLRSSGFLAASPVPLTARATALQALGKVAEAEAVCRRALLLDPSFAAAHWNLALNLLLQGRYKEGWQEYEWRWRKPDFSSPIRHTDVPLWDGSPLDGRTILLHAEQGFGDAIQFVRYVPLVARCGENVILECHPQLVSLFQGIKGIKSVIAFGETVPEYDCQAPFLTLPRIFGSSLESIPACPLLSIPVERLSKWQQRTARYYGPKVGLVWAGSSIHRNDSLRSIPLKFFSTFSMPAEINLFSLQLGAAKHQLELSSLAEHVIDLTDQIHDFADTAALIEQLDLVISIDTAVAHLAASMGKPVYLLLPFAPDWRWLLDRSDSPWYPTIRIFRQKQPGDWGEVMTRIHPALATLRDAIKKPLRLPPKD
jgi:cytochrome c-type biogenesis protein CcmH/NrfG